MNKKIKDTFFIIIVLLLAGKVCADTEGGAVAVKSPWDFGSIRKGVQKERTFTVRNSGDKALVIDDIHACCGYSVEDVSGWEISPGEKSMITVRCDTSRKYPGEDIKYITIRYGAPSGDVLKVPVKVMVLEK